MSLLQCASISCWYLHVASEAVVVVEVVVVVLCVVVAIALSTPSNRYEYKSKNELINGIGVKLRCWRRSTVLTYNMESVGKWTNSETSQLFEENIWRWLTIKGFWHENKLFPGIVENIFASATINLHWWNSPIQEAIQSQIYCCFLRVEFKISQNS